ncbi:LOW QUALITY PROTEIN: hypothetical protein HID58_071540, partial [Brassica napus]
QNFRQPNLRVSCYEFFDHLCFVGVTTCGHDMDEYCMVMAGDWVCGEDEKWNFFMSRMVPFREGITLSELEANVMKEFSYGGKLESVGLSYWPPSSIELATGIRTPPVLLTNDGAVGFFSRHLKVGAPMNLFAKFDAFDLGNQSSRDESRAKGYRTPAQAMKRKMFDDVWSSGKVSSAASKIDNVVVEEDELLREVEKVEEKIRGESLRSNEGEPCETSDSDSSLADEVDDRDVRPRGYDKEFWAPFIREDNDGSDVVDKVFNAEDTTRRTYSCTTNNAFDNTVVAGGSSSSNAKTTAEAEDDLRLSTSYMKCYRDIDIATSEVTGTDEESFLKLP